MHTVPYHEQSKDLTAETTVQVDPVPTETGQEYLVEAILKHRKKGNGFQFLTLMQGDPNYDAEWQPTKDFVDSDGTMNETFYECIKKNGILQNLWFNQHNNVVGTTTGEGGE